MAEYDVTAQRDRVAWVERMLLKGLLPVNRVNAEREGLRRLELVLELLRGEHRMPLPPPNVAEKKGTASAK